MLRLALVALMPLRALPLMVRRFIATFPPLITKIESEWLGLSMTTPPAGSLLIVRSLVPANVRGLVSS